VLAAIIKEQKHPAMWVLQPAHLNSPNWSASKLTFEKFCEQVDITTPPVVLDAAIAANLRDSLRKYLLEVSVPPGSAAELAVQEEDRSGSNQQPSPEANSRRTTRNRAKSSAPAKSGPLKAQKRSSSERNFKSKSKKSKDKHQNDSNQLAGSLPAAPTPLPPPSHVSALSMPMPTSMPLSPSFVFSQQPVTISSQEYAHLRAIEAQVKEVQHIIQCEICAVLHAEKSKCNCKCHSLLKTNFFFLNYHQREIYNL